jgi:hypothetical protein
MDDDPACLFNDDVQLVAWGDSHTSGPWVKLRLTDSSLLDVFRGMTVAKGNQAGQLMRCVLLEPVEAVHNAEAPQAPAAAKPKGGPLSRLAGRWCKDEHFQKWLLDTFPEACRAAEERVVRYAGAEDHAAAVLRIICQVSSRAELDQSEEAAERFHRLIRGPYSAMLYA